MKFPYFISLVLAVAHVSAAGINLNVRDNDNIARNPDCHLLRRDDPANEKKHSTTPKKTTSNKHTTTKKTTKKTTSTTCKTTTPKTTKSTKVTTPKISTTKPTTTKSTATCGTESAQCDPTGTALPPCCQGQCLQGFDFYFCRTSCLPDGSPCTLDHPEVCCGQVCLVDGHCVTIE